MAQKKKLVPPDGGWGWAVMLSYAVFNLITYPMAQSAGLLFKDKFRALGMSATDSSVVISTYAGFGMVMGLINGPLLRRFGYRKIAIISAAFTFFGITLSTFANSFLQFFITFGLIASVGNGLGISSFSLALSTYFVKNRGRATGYGMTITGIGSVLVPQLLSYLMSEYGVEGAILIIGAISSHTLFAALLLQPVEWHLKEEEVPEGQQNQKNDESEEALLDKVTSNEEKCLPKNEDSNLEVNGRPRSNSSSSHTAFKKPPNNADQENKWRSEMTISSNSTKIEKANTHKEEMEMQPPTNHPKSVKGEEESSTLRSTITTIVNFFDLDLLKDPIYLNIMIGMSLAMFAEISFSLLTPFFMADFGLTVPEIATFLSTMAGTDIVFRFFSPFIGEYLKKSPRIIYLVSLVMLIVTRSSILLVEGYVPLLGVAVGLGIAKGVRTVYLPLVIPSYVPIERLASAAGLQMVGNGLCIFVGGPALGIIRDVTGSYDNSIYLMNFVTFSAIIMWTTELIYLKLKKSKKLNAIP